MIKIQPIRAKSRLSSTNESGPGCLKHHHVEQSPRRQALQGVDHQIGDLAGTELSDDNPHCNTQATGEAEHSEVGVEYELPGGGL